MKLKNIFKFIFLIGIFLITFSLSFSSVIGRINTDNVNVREYPSTRSRSVEKLKKDDNVYVSGIKGAWYEVEAEDDSFLYISSEFIDISEHEIDLVLPSHEKIPDEFWEETYGNEQIKFLVDELVKIVYSTEEANNSLLVETITNNLDVLKKELKEVDYPENLDSIVRNVIKNINTSNNGETGEYIKTVAKNIFNSVGDIKDDIANSKYIKDLDSMAKNTIQNITDFVKDKTGDDTSTIVKEEPKSAEKEITTLKQDVIPKESNEPKQENVITIEEPSPKKVIITEEKPPKQDIALEETEKPKQSEAKESKKETAPLTQAEKIIAYAKQFIGTPYRYGGTNLRSGIDCSGLIYMSFRQFDISLPRVSKEMAKSGVAVSKSKLIPGDLVFFDSNGPNNGDVTHAGIYIGNNEFIHASTSKGVIITKLDNVYWKDRYINARRILK